VEGRNPFIILALLVLIIAGFMADIFLGLPLSLYSRSWSTWLLGILALGIIYLVGEAGGGWINARDKVTHPLWKRVWHLVLLIGFAAAVGTVAMAVLRMAQ
jgi:hypothetical protein